MIVEQRPKRKPRIEPWRLLVEECLRQREQGQRPLKQKSTSSMNKKACVTGIEEVEVREVTGGQTTCGLVDHRIIHS